MYIYDYMRLPIRVAFFGFILIALGSFVQSESVNIFYTFHSTLLISASDIMKKIGEAIVINLPLVIMVNIVCKKANSGLPIVLAITGYLTFAVTTMLFGPQNMPSTAYLNYGLVPAMAGRYPLRTGIIGSFLVGYATRYAYMRSRHRSSYSFLAFTSRDTTALIYNSVACFVLGLLISYAYGPFYGFLQRAITYISQDLMDYRRLALYGFLDRSLSILGLGNLIRQPFWFTAAGGSYSNPVTGTAILGDVTIWDYIREYNSAFLGAGRFITPYYVINLFLIPAYYIGTAIYVRDRSERLRFHLSVGFMAVLSILAGNPYPAELAMLITTPSVLLMYLLLVAGLFGLFVSQSIFLGFSFPVGDTTVAMPGNFPDLIINLRNYQYSETVPQIVIVGLIAFAVMLGIVVLYYEFFAYDVTSSGRKKKLVEDLLEAVGGIENVDAASTGLFRLFVDLKDLENVSFEQLQTLGARRITETRTGISVEFGSSSHILAKEIRKKMKTDLRN